MEGSIPSFEWFWTLHNEHRLVLPKIVRLSLLRASGFDFKSCIYASNLILSLVSLLACLAVAKLRGRFIVSDAVFPLILMNWGQTETLVWGFQLQFTLGVMFTMLALIAIASSPNLKAGSAAFVGGSLCLLTLCGANGVIASFPVAMWLGLRTMLAFRRKEMSSGKRFWIAVVACLLFIFVYDAIYILSNPTTAPHATLRQYIKAAVAFPGLAFGPPFANYWILRGSFMCCLMLVTAAVLARAAWRAPEFLRATGILAVLSIYFITDAAVSHKNAPSGLSGIFSARYTTLVIPIFCVFYYAFELYKINRLGRAPQYLLLAIAIAMSVRSYRTPAPDFQIFKTAPGIL